MRGGADFRVIADCAEFRIRRVVLGAGRAVSRRRRASSRGFVSVVSGSLSVQAGGQDRAFGQPPAERGENIVLCQRFGMGLSRSPPTRPYRSLLRDLKNFECSLNPPFSA